MSPHYDDHGDVLFLRVFAGKHAELKWSQNVRSLLTPYIRAMHVGYFELQVEILMTVIPWKLIRFYSPCTCTRTVHVQLLSIYFSQFLSSNFCSVSPGSSVYEILFRIRQKHPPGRISARRDSH